MATAIKLLIMEEIWKDIHGYDGYYQVSNYGKIKSLFRKVPHKSNGLQTYKVKILRPHKTSNGYYMIDLYDNRNNRKKYSIHRLVCLSFVNNPNINYKYINHKDGNKLNNNYLNLEWCTSSQNNKHAYKIGLKVGYFTGITGAKHHKSKSVLQFTLTGNLINTYGSIGEASRETGISASNIAYVCRNVKYKSAGGFIWKFKNAI